VSQQGSEKVVALWDFAWCEKDFEPRRYEGHEDLKKINRSSSRFSYFHAKS